MSLTRKNSSFFKGKLLFTLDCSQLVIKTNYRQKKKINDLKKIKVTERIQRIKGHQDTVDAQRDGEHSHRNL